MVNTSWANKFDSLVDFTEDKIKHWLVTFVNKNDDHLSSVDQLHSEFKEIEEEILSLSVKKYITIPPMNEYIYEWLKKSLQ